MKRRTFISYSAAAIGACTIPHFSIAQNTEGKFKYLRVGCIGMGRMMYWHVNVFMQSCQLVAVCDVDKTRRESERDRVNAHYGNTQCVAYNDYREILNRDDIDIVVIATPDHWHATLVIEAARAGKHIYCEKPLTHDIDESIRVMEEVKKAGVILQTGSQQRLNQEFRVAADLVRNEVAGKVLRIDSDFWGPPKPCAFNEEAMEPGLDWNLWCGPAPVNPYNSALSPRGVHEKFPMGWRGTIEYGGGGITDMGAHHLDIIQMAIDRDNSGPTQALPPADGGQGYGAKLIYADGLEVTRQKGFHIDFRCENGRIQVSRGKFHFQLEGKTIHKFVSREDGGSMARAVTLTEREFLQNAAFRFPKQKRGGHKENFLDAILADKQPVAHAEVGARSAICCHLMNLAYQHQQKIGWDPQKLTFTDPNSNPSWMSGSRRNFRFPT
ncbi:MAG: Gfo/Idh/MocA family oxidoreductase [Verrucomicrobiota bacterium]